MRVSGNPLELMALATTFDAHGLRMRQLGSEISLSLVRFSSRPNDFVIPVGDLGGVVAKHGSDLAELGRSVRVSAEGLKKADSGSVSTDTVGTTTRVTKATAKLAAIPKAAKNPIAAGWGDPRRAKVPTTRITVAGVSVLVNATTAPLFEAFLKELVASGYQLRQNDTGGWNPRQKKNSKHNGGPLTKTTPVGAISNHSWGNAIDVNWKSNPYDSSKRTDLPANISELAGKYGLRWGGDYTGGATDKMHFEFVGTPQQAIERIKALGLVASPSPQPSSPQADKATADARTVKLSAARIAEMTGKQGGDRNWRNNNPGNIRAGAFALAHGQIAVDNKGFAVFASYQDGKDALTALLKTPRYANLSILEAWVNYYAPAADHNDPVLYATVISRQVGVPRTTLIRDLTPAQLGKLEKAIEHFEGGRPGRIVPITAPERLKVPKPNPDPATPLRPAGPTPHMKPRIPVLRPVGPTDSSSPIHPTPIQPIPVMNPPATVVIGGTEPVSLPHVGIRILAPAAFDSTGTPQPTHN